MDSLLAQVVHVFGSAQPHVAYAFANARANRIKVLLSDGYGLWLCTRRLHQGSLDWPTGADTQMALTAQQWQALTVGLPWQRLGSSITLV
jgi:transposase